LRDLPRAFASLLEETDYYSAELAAIYFPKRAGDYN